jgi:hypothetical protein
MTFDATLIIASLLLFAALGGWIGWLMGHSSNASAATRAWRAADHWKLMFEESERRRKEAYHFTQEENKGMIITRTE